MEPTQYGLIVAGVVILLTIGAVALNQQQPKRERTFKKIDDPYALRRSDGTGTNVYDPVDGEWKFFPNKGGKRKTRRK